ncbi:MAG TPA: phage tail sheath subtilisin-like domain-containing protein [Coleofasciculaceae cyanobacterium]
MPIAPTYPGVYIEEIPSGVRTITGVATSITAFIGRALRGPVNEPITINSYGDFERTFGGLWVASTLGYAVRDFYQNGGSQAIIVRLHHVTTPANNTDTAKITVGGLSLEAASPGTWGKNLRVRVDQNNIEPDVAQQLNVAVTDLFNLTIQEDIPGGATEQFFHLTVKESARRVDEVLAVQSNLVRWSGILNPASLPTVSANQGAAAGGLDGLPLTYGANDTDDLPGSQANKTGLYALEKADLFNLLCLPPYKADGNVDSSLISDAATYCERRRAMLIVDPPSGWMDKTQAKNQFTGTSDPIGTRSKNAALFFPRLVQPNPLRNNQMEAFAPCGAIAGIFARTDAQRGVWKAPAGQDAVINGAAGLSVSLTDPENGELNQLGISCLRNLSAAGLVVWGSRTLQGDDRLASEWKYIPVRRFALFLEESLYRGTQWVVFEPNDEPLWSQIRLNLGAFMNNLFRQGAFQGKTPKDAYFVKCDSETTTQNDINLGIVNIVVGFAPLKPAEFVIIKFQQMAGQVAT